ncbi:tetratricopeptide repeat protein [Gracilimonas mengyeensis]|uniref:Tetratricopeptide repeat-containing protein n=1 Tax=Gracilimonas mengyeensis TaxID=1302730 RepID=A0A521CWJ4_9BACT|nr:tetratricopeptide repeat protein [Gracilimonas mengyeensis]SMO63778.1 Tetratricopeptide repeat-containing protein [Gracilimonas mengyeensis]
MKKLILILGILLVSSSLTRAQADCNETPPDGLSPIAAYSLFYENYRNGDYQFALKYGKWMACAKPDQIEGNPQFKLDTQYNRLVNIYTEIGRAKEDPEERSAYIDTALTLINESLELFGDTPEEEFDIIFRRGRFYQENYDAIENGLQKAYDDYQKMIELNPEKGVSAGDGYYLRVLLEYLVDNDMKERAQTVIDVAEPVAQGQTLDMIKEKQQELLGSPEEQIAYYEPLIKDEPENVEAWKALAGAYGSVGERQKQRNALIKVNELESSYESAYAVAEQAASDARYADAAKYFKQALDRAETDDQREELYMRLADAYISLEQLPAAKQYVQRAREIAPNDGNVYLKMATVYGAAVTQCTENRKLEAADKVVYWVVIDYLNRAKQVDSSVANTVNRQLSTYKDVTPNAEDKFFTLSLEDGDSITIDGSRMDCYSWINETTTVR